MKVAPPKRRAIPIDLVAHTKLKHVAVDLGTTLIELTEAALRHFLDMSKAERQAIYERGSK